MDDDNVIHAFPTSELPENLVQVAPKASHLPYHCEHGAVRLDEHDRSVQCTKCGAMLDPFNFILKQAKTLQTAWDNYKYVRRELNEVTERITYLKKEEQRIKARIKRLQSKTDTIVIYDPTKQL